MRSLTDRLRLSWLTVVALAVFVVVALIGPDDVNLVRLFFAPDANRFQELLQQGNPTLRFETVTLLRAHLAADMMFLVAYGLLLRASIRVLPSTPFGRFAPHGPVLVMIADAAENVLALQCSQDASAKARSRRQPSIVAMNVAAATKWLAGRRRAVVAGRRVAQGSKAPGPLPPPAPWLIAGAFGVGGVAFDRSHRRPLLQRCPVADDDGVACSRGGTAAPVPPARHGHSDAAVSLSVARPDTRPADPGDVRADRPRTGRRPAGGHSGRRQHYRRGGDDGRGDYRVVRLRHADQHRARARVGACAGRIPPRAR